jgi:hypothetical protein
MKHHYECRCGPKRVYDCAPLRMENVCVQVCLPPGLGDAPCLTVDRQCVCVEVYDVKPGKGGCVLLCGALVLTLCAGRVRAQAQVPFQVQMRTPCQAPYEVAVLLDTAQVCSVVCLGGNLYAVTLLLCGNYYIVVTAPGCCPDPPACVPLYPPDCREDWPQPPPKNCPPVCPPPCPPVCPPPCPPPCPPVCPPPCPPVCPPPCPPVCPPHQPGHPDCRPQPPFDLGPGPCDPCRPVCPPCPPPRPRPWRPARVR